MNAHQRRKHRRALYWQPGCNNLGYSGTTTYPDLMCMNGYMVDADADGWDPTDAHLPCKHCRPDEHKAWIKDSHE